MSRSKDNSIKKNKTQRKTKTLSKKKKLGVSSKKKSLKKKGGFPFGYQSLPDYSVSTIDIDSYGGKTYNLRCSVCGGNEFMLGQGMIKAGRFAQLGDAAAVVSTLGVVQDVSSKQTIMCVCANCSYVHWFRKSSFVKKRDELYSRNYGYSYGNSRDNNQTRDPNNKITYESYNKRDRQPSGWRRNINPFNWFRGRRPNMSNYDSTQRDQRDPNISYNA